MTRAIIRYAPNGDIIGLRHEIDHDYTLGTGELDIDDQPEFHRPGAVDGMLVDLSTDPPSIVENPEFDPRTPLEILEDRLDTLETDNPVRRRVISDESKQAFRDARDVDDVQTQFDILFEILTGEAAEVEEPA